MDKLKKEGAMKISVVIFLCFYATLTFATHDGCKPMFVVSKDFSEDKFFVEQVVACNDTNQDAIFYFFTEKFSAPVLEENVPPNKGKNFFAKHNVSELTCAIFNYEGKMNEGSYFMSLEDVTEVKMNLKKCPYKDNPKFITMLKTAVVKNFPRKKGEVKLTLVTK